MNRFTGVSVLMLLPWAIAAHAATDAAVEMAPAIEFPHVGVALSVPEGFQFQQPDEQHLVMRSVLKDGEKAGMAITLSAYLVDGETTTEKFAERMLDELQADLRVRRLEVLKETPMPVAKLEGKARLLTYTYRGEKTTSAGVCFIRELTSPAVRICYLLQIEALEKRAVKVLPIFGEVVKSVSLTEVRSPADSPFDPTGPATVDLRRGFSIRLPVRWFVRPTATGIRAALSDYLRGGLPIPVLQVAVIDGSPQMTSRECGRAGLAEAQKGAYKAGLKDEVLSEGPATLGGLAAHEFVLLQSTAPQTKPATAAAPTTTSGPAATAPAAASAPATATQPAEGAKSVIIAQRTACLPGPAGRRRSYSLVLAYPGGDGNAARAMLEKLAAGFSLRKAPASPPAGATEKK